jgi:hypothetical protein
MLDMTGGNAGNIAGVGRKLKRTNNGQTAEWWVFSCKARDTGQELAPIAVAATWVIRFTIVITRTVGIVDAGEKRGVDGAPIISVGENAVYLVNYYRKEGYSLEPKRLTQPS